MSEKEIITLIARKNKEIKILKHKFMNPMKRRLGIRHLEKQIIALSIILSKSKSKCSK